MLAAPLLLSALLAAPPGDGADAPVVLSGTEIAASVRVGERPLMVWHAAIKPDKRDYVPLPKPFVFPLYTPSGVNVLDYASDDHPHHKGVWVSVDEVELHPDGKHDAETMLGPYKHWVEQGRIDTQDVKLDREAGSITAVNHWLNPEGEPVLKEETTIAVHDLSPKGSLLTYDITLSPPTEGSAVTIGDTKEGFVGVRMAPELDVKRGAGVITNSEGAEGENEAWGKLAAWCDCSAPATDEFPGGGVALFDHPENVRPARYHARGYGLMAISPFGPKAYSKGEEDADPIEIKEPLRLRYAVYVHDGDAEAGDVAGAYERYVDSIAK
ncbi:PmoA family protein [Alienimonas sp. DA493]|uniref:DUF6807 domain-containing protein n=1 Tax=Alienimonas sp. DA493 TaxID=3373605 RepID=UPI003754C08F